MQNSVQKGLTTKQIVLILGSITIICAAVIIVIFLLRDKSDITPVGTPIINMENVNEIGREVEDKVAKGMFETHMNTTWTFPDGKSPSSDAVMGNSASNNYAFYFTVTLSDTGETVFTSGLIPVGAQISEIKLEKELAAGAYSAVVAIHMVEDDGTPVENNMGINVTLNVKS